MLVLVVVVSLAVLLLLARFRFPEANLASVTPSPGPLAGMAAQATFDEMSTTLGGLLTRAAPTVDVLRLEPAASEKPGEAAAPAAGRRFAPALRLRADLALLHVPAGWQPVGIGDHVQPIQVVLSDVDREIAIVRVPAPGGSTAALPATAPGVTGMLYVAVIQATRSGPTLHPAFVGRIDVETDARWAAPLLVIGGGAAVPVGPLVYTIDARLIGLASRHDTGVAIVPAAALDDVVARVGGAANE